MARELTKLHEECRVDTPAALIAHYEAKPPKGEIVLLVEPPHETEPSVEDVDMLLREALKTEKPSQAAAKVAKAKGLKKWATCSPDYAYGRSNTAEFMEYAKHFDGNITVVEETWPKLFQPDYTEVVTKLLNAKGKPRPVAISVISP